MTAALEGNRLARRHAWAYGQTAPATITTIERAVEAFLYQPAVRQKLGLRAAVNLYAGTGVVTNSLYAKINPTTVARSFACAIVLTFARIWTRVASRALPRMARPEREPPKGLRWGKRLHATTTGLLSRSSAPRSQAHERSLDVDTEPLQTPAARHRQSELARDL